MKKVFFNFALLMFASLLWNNASAREVVISGCDGTTLITIYLDVQTNGYSVTDVLVDNAHPDCTPIASAGTKLGSIEWSVRIPSFLPRQIVISGCDGTTLIRVTLDYSNGGYRVVSVSHTHNHGDCGKE